MAKKGKDEDVYEATQEKEKNDVGVDTNLPPPLVFQLTTGKSYISAHTHTDPSILVPYTLSYLQLLTLAGTYLPA